MSYDEKKAARVFLSSPKLSVLPAPTELLNAVAMGAREAGVVISAGQGNVLYTPPPTPGRRVEKAVAVGYDAEGIWIRPAHDTTSELIRPAIVYNAIDNVFEGKDFDDDIAPTPGQRKPRLDPVAVVAEAIFNCMKTLYPDL